MNALNNMIIFKGDVPEAGLIITVAFGFRLLTLVSGGDHKTFGLKHCQGSGLYPKYLE